MGPELAHAYMDIRGYAESKEAAHAAQLAIGPENQFCAANGRLRMCGAIGEGPQSEPDYFCFGSDTDPLRDLAN